MMLAEALVLRADQQKRLAELTKRIESNVRVPQGTRPDEEPNDLLRRAEETSADLTTLIRRINRTNAATVAAESTADTISDLIAERDRAQRMSQVLRGAAQAATRGGGGRGWLSRDAEVTEATVNVPALQAEADRWAIRYRELDVQLQRLNWETELME